MRKIMGDLIWITTELVLWVVTPVVAVIFTKAMSYLINKYIFQKSDARKRTLKFIPYQVSATFSFMLFILIAKDVHELTDKDLMY